MTKKDYIAIAAVIKAALDRGEDWNTVVGITSDIVETFEADNPRFNRTVFLTACGLAPV